MTDYTRNEAALRVTKHPVYVPTVMALTYANNHNPSAAHCVADRYLVLPKAGAQKHHVGGLSCFCP